MRHAESFSLCYAAKGAKREEIVESLYWNRWIAIQRLGTGVQGATQEF